MASQEEKEGTTVFRRTPEYKPPRSWRTWLVGRPLATADAPQQTIGKAIGLAVTNRSGAQQLSELFKPEEDEPRGQNF